MTDDISQSSPSLEEPADSVLFQRIVSGDQDAMQALFARYQSRLVAHAAHILHSEDLAQDIAQETFLKLLDNPPSQLQDGLLGPWLFRVAKNLAIDRQRREKFEIPAGSPGDLPHGSCTAPEDDPLSSLMASNDAEQLRRLCRELPPELQEILSDRMVRNLSFQQIADREHIPLGTALWRVHHAFEILRRKWLAES